MTSTLPLEYASPPRARFTLGWINLSIAALAMVATLPGRTQGIGQITEALLKDFKLDADLFSIFNIWITLIGSTFCLAVGPLIDRFGARVVLAVNVAALGATVLAMSFADSAAALFVTLTLSRGLGQSALSVVSLAIIGKWFSKRLPMAMAVFAIITGIGFMMAIPGVKFAADSTSWRGTWFWMGVIYLGLVLPLSIFFVRRTPESVGLQVDGGAVFFDPTEEQPLATDHTLMRALRTRTFWILALASALFLLVNTGLMLYYERVLKAYGADQNTIYAFLGIVILAGFICNFLGGYLARKWPLGLLMGIAMFILAGGLLALPPAHGPVMIYVYALGMGVSGGIITVIFFSCWGKLFGRTHLGAIQGAAQVLTVIGSAIGPWLLTESLRIFGSYNIFFYVASPVVAVLGVFCLIAKPPLALRGNARPW